MRLSGPGRGLRRLDARPALLAPLSFGLSGTAFVVANLLLARVLPVEQYALMALLVSVVNVSMVAAPLGIDGVVARGSAAVSRRLLGRVLLAAVVVALAAAIYLRLTAGVGPLIAGLLIVCVSAAAITLVVAAQFQAAQAFARSLFYLRSQDFALLFASAAAIAVSARHALTPFAFLTGAFVAVAIAAWRDGVRRLQPASGQRSSSWYESIAYLSVQLSGTLSMQLERLLTPSLLTLKDLAALGVVLALVGPPFRLLQMTAGYALQPRLRAAESDALRVRLLINEGLLAAAIVLVASVGLWFVTPLLTHFLLRDKVFVGPSLLLAALVSGALKVASGFAKACMTALASDRELALAGAIGWIAVAVAVVGASAGARYGLSGIVYGVAAGWALRVATAAWMVVRRLRRKRT